MEELLIILIISFPTIFQLIIGNKAVNKFIRLPFWLVCLISILMIILFGVAFDKFFVIWILQSIVLIPLIIIQTFVLFMNKD